MLKATITRQEFIKQSGQADKCKPKIDTHPAGKLSATKPQSATPVPPCRATPAQIAEIKAVVARYQRLKGQARPLVRPPQTKALTATAAPQPQIRCGPTAAQIAQIKAVVASYQIQKVQEQPVVRPPETKALTAMAAPQATSNQPSAAQIAAIKATVARYQMPKPMPRIAPAAFGKPADTKPLPRWGDKDCQCHEAFSLFQAHKYREAAAAYKKAGDNMLKAWGHPTTDVANALRGEAICLEQAGQLPQARDLLKQAVDMYIRCGNGNPPKQLADSLGDLSSTYQAMGVGRTALMVKASTPRIFALSRGNPAQAALEFERLANN